MTLPNNSRIAPKSASRSVVMCLALIHEPITNFVTQASSHISDG